MGGLDFNSPATIVCGFSVLCCGFPALLMLMISRLSGGRLALLPMVLSMLPMVGNEVLGWFLNRGDNKEEAEMPLSDMMNRVRQRRQGFSARVQQADQQFNAQISGGHSPDDFDTFDRSDPTQFPADAGSVGSVKDSSRFGVRSNRSEPNRILRDKRYDRNRGPSKLPDDLQEGMFDAEGNLKAPKGEDLLGPASLPGLRGRDTDDFDAPRRTRRDKRGRGERTDDEVFGGYFDEDGDGYSDY